ncbi:hypothetical protein VTK26DRAFT_7004 [Humicola hyalothermophila]
MPRVTHIPFPLPLLRRYPSIPIQLTRFGMAEPIRPPLFPSSVLRPPSTLYPVRHSMPRHGNVPSRALHLASRSQNTAYRHKELQTISTMQKPGMRKRKKKSRVFSPGHGGGDDDECREKRPETPRPVIPYMRYNPYPMVSGTIHYSWPRGREEKRDVFVACRVVERSSSWWRFLSFCFLFFFSPPLLLSLHYLGILRFR